ncbi:MAG: hypothetical protein ACYDC9_01575 [Dermatophilaceae bacterium]
MSGYAARRSADSRSTTRVPQPSALWPVQDGFANGPVQLEELGVDHSLSGPLRGPDLALQLSQQAWVVVRQRQLGWGHSDHDAAQLGQGSHWQLARSLTSVDLPRVLNPPTGPGLPNAGRQQTISVPMTVRPKLRQREMWGSPAWVTSFKRRTRVEGSFGLLKNGNTGNVKRGWTRQVGIIKTTLLRAVAVAASHLRQLLTWSGATGDVTDPLTVTTPRRRARDSNPRWV